MRCLVKQKLSIVKRKGMKVLAHDVQVINQETEGRPQYNIFTLCCLIQAGLTLLEKCSCILSPLRSLFIGDTHSLHVQARAREIFGVISSDWLRFLIHIHDEFCKDHADFGVVLSKHRLNS